MEKYLISGRQYTRTCISYITRPINLDGKQEGRLKTDVELNFCTVFS